MGLINGGESVYVGINGREVIVGLYIWVGELEWVWVNTEGNLSMLE